MNCICQKRCIIGEGPIWRARPAEDCLIGLEIGHEFLKK